MTPGTAVAEPRPSEVGWPAPPHKGRGLGWPGDLTSDGDRPSGGEASPEDPAPTARRRSWRRLFGANPAA